MITDTLKNISLYRGISQNIDTAIDFIEKTDLHALSDGRHVVDGENVYVNVMSPQFKEQNTWEAHQDYIDIQIALQDGETIQWLPLEDVPGWSAYDAEGDCILSHDNNPGMSIPMKKGQFALFFPKDAHKPALGSGQGHKAVVKVRV